MCVDAGGVQLSTLRLLPGVPPTQPTLPPPVASTSPLLPPASYTPALLAAGPSHPAPPHSNRWPAPMAARTPDVDHTQPHLDFHSHLLHAPSTLLPCVVGVALNVVDFVQTGVFAEVDGVFNVRLWCQTMFDKLQMWSESAAMWHPWLTSCNLPSTGVLKQHGGVAVRWWM